MSENTSIEWADHSFNPWEGCQKVGPGCDHCYAETRNARFAGGTAINWGPGAPRRRTSAANWRKPLAWNAAHAEFYAAHGHRQRVFCASLADVFDNAVDPTWRADLADLIQATPNLDWLLLTKRIGNAGDMLGAMFLDGVPDNVLLGATIVNQEEADRDIPRLLRLAVAYRFLSMEPLLGAVNLTNYLWQSGSIDPSTMEWEDGAGHLRRQRKAIHQVIGGGESGPRARPMHPAWVRSLRDQCASAGVPFLLKQWGEFHPACDHDPKSHKDNLETVAVHVDGDNEYRPLEVFGLAGEPGWEVMCRVGKRAAGRELDGHTYNGFPEVK